MRNKGFFAQLNVFISIAEMTKRQRNAMIPRHIVRIPIRALAQVCVMMIRLA